MPWSSGPAPPVRRTSGHQPSWPPQYTAWRTAARPPCTQNRRLAPHPGGMYFPASVMYFRQACCAAWNTADVSIEAVRVDRYAVGVHGRVGEVRYAVRAHAVGELEHQRGDDLLLRRGQLSPVREQVQTCPICRRGSLEAGSVRLGLDELPLAVRVGPVRRAVRAHAVRIADRDLVGSTGPATRPNWPSHRCMPPRARRFPLLRRPARSPATAPATVDGPACGCRECRCS